MKKIFYFVVIVVIFAACKYDEKPFGFLREYDKETFMTSDGVAKYISAKPTIILVTKDVYAIVKDSVTFNKNSVDSIIFYGHCWSKEPNPIVHRDSSTKFMVDNNGDKIPDGYVTDLGTVDHEAFTSTAFNLEDETTYYIRGYIITGDIDEGTQTYDIAYNPGQVDFMTDIPVDEWKKKAQCTAPLMKGAVSFIHDNELYIGLGNNGAYVEKAIYKYNPANDEWIYVTAYPGTIDYGDGTVTGTGTEYQPLSNAVAFVMENLTIGHAEAKDYVYIGTGFCLDGSDTVVSKDFHRWDFGDQWKAIDEEGAIFKGGKRQNAVAFSIGKYGYVGLGTGEWGSVLQDFYRFDPNAQALNPEAPFQGEWKKIKDFSTTRTKAVSFVIEDFGYVGCGEDRYGVYYNDFWKFSPTTDDGDWIRLEPFPGTARIEAVGMAIGPMGYIGTGWDGDSLCADYYRYNPYAQSWDIRAKFIGTPRAEAIGEGLEFSPNDFRGYLGLGRQDPETDIVTDFYVYRP